MSIPGAIWVLLLLRTMEMCFPAIFLLLWVGFVGSFSLGADEEVLE